jgi:hypothetical protein
MELGLRDDGTMEVPPTGFPAGWYTGAPTPGELGPAVIAGHVDWTGPGVFYNLHKLVAGNEVRVARADGSTAVFRVARVEKYRKTAFPTDAVFGDAADGQALCARTRSLWLLTSKLPVLRMCASRARRRSSDVSTSKPGTCHGTERSCNTTAPTSK